MDLQKTINKLKDHAPTDPAYHPITSRLTDKEKELFHRLIDRANLNPNKAIRVAVLEWMIRENTKWEREGK